MTNKPGGRNLPGLCCFFACDFAPLSFLCYGQPFFGTPEPGRVRTMRLMTPVTP